MIRQISLCAERCVSQNHTRTRSISRSSRENPRRTVNSTTMLTCSSSRKSHSRPTKSGARSGCGTSNWIGVRWSCGGRIGANRTETSSSEQHVGAHPANFLQKQGGHPDHDVSVRKYCVRGMKHSCMKFFFWEESGADKNLKRIVQTTDVAR